MKKIFHENVLFLLTFRGFTFVIPYPSPPKPLPFDLLKWKFPPSCHDVWQFGCKFWSIWTLISKSLTILSIIGFSNLEVGYRVTVYEFSTVSLEYLTNLSKSFEPRECLYINTSRQKI